MSKEDYLLELDSEEIFGLSQSHRTELIKASAQLYKQQVEMGAVLLDIPYEEFLSVNIQFTEKEIQKLTETENYEVCYFLNEIINKIKSE